MTLTSKQRFELKKLLTELRSHRGRHTEFVTVYIPVGYDINKIINHLSQEQGTATNIKSASTRKNVIDALEKMIQHLRIYKQTPEHGLAAFAGNVAARDGQQDFKVWSIEPPLPINTRLYRCDKTFITELLDEMLDVTENYGLVVMDRREANIAFLKGKKVLPQLHLKSNVPGKTKAGGQSAARYMRIREDAAKDFYKKIAEAVKDQFFSAELKGILVGGPGQTKYEWIDGSYITNELKKKILTVKDISYTDEFGLQELVEKSQDILANEEIAQEKKLMQEFFNLLSTTPDKVAYGIDHVKKSLVLGAVDKILVSEKMDEKVIEELDEEAKAMGSELSIISTDTREGVQLVSMGKIAAILRYELTSQ